MLRRPVPTGLGARAGRPAPGALPLSPPGRAAPERIVRFIYHRPGKGTSVFAERLVVDRHDLKVLEVPCYRGPPVRVGKEVVLEPGARALWFVMPGAWYDIGRFHLVDGRLTGWYTNFCTPVALDATEWSATDLFLDHWLSPDGWDSWLDEDELTHAAAAGLLTHDSLRQLEDARSRVGRLVAAGDWPPEPIRRWPEDPLPAQPSRF